MKDPRILRTKAAAAFGSADTLWHTLQQLPPDLGTVRTDENRVFIMFRMLDGAGDILTLTGTAADVTVVPVAVAADGTFIVGGAETLTSHDLWEPISAQIPPGWSFSVHLGIISGSAGGAANLQIHYQPFRA